MAIENISLVGGHIALDFVNTVGDHLSAQPSEWLHHYDDLATWAAHAGVITRGHVKRLRELSAAKPDLAAAALDKAIDLREAIFRLLLGTIRKQAPDKQDITAFNAALQDAPARTFIAFENGHYEWRFASVAVSLDDPLRHILWAAADLLTSDRLAQVKVCEGDECGWMFLDTSRNQARRWCSMADCGNRAKANRYYQRRKGDVPP